MLLEQVTIWIKKQQLLNKGISSEIIDKLLQCDPTNNYKSDTDKVGSYTDWITSRYLKDRQFNDFDKLHSQLEQYDKSKHKIPDKELQNIGQFKTLDELILYINNNQDKLVIKSDKFVIEEKNDYDMFYSKNYIIHVPHTKEQSKILGSGTKWCTSQEKDNYFHSYYNEGYLFYITDKTTTQKRYNLYLQNKGAKIEFADDKNKHLTYKFFDIVKEDNTLIPQIKFYYEYKNIGIQSKINKLFQCKSVFDIVTFWEHNINTLAPAYFETNETRLINIASKYHQYGIQFISNPSQEMQIQQLNADKLNINFIESIAKKAQIQYVSMDTQQFNIMYLINQGIKPEHDVQLQQVSKNGQQIQYIINAGIKPIEQDVQLQQVSQNGYQIKHIIDAGIRPEYDVQMQQVKQTGDQIKYIINAGIKPIEQDVQLQQVSQNGYQIGHIINAGIIPEHDVQLQQVKQTGDQIKYIINAGIKPEYDIQLQQVSHAGVQISQIINAGVQPEDENEWHDIQLQQVTQSGYQIRYIINAGIRPDHDIQLQQVTQYGNQIYYIINAGIRPDHDIQLQQVTQYGNQIYYIIDAGIKPEHDVQLQQVTQNGYQIQSILDAGIRPEYDIQLQQIKQNPDQYKYIQNPAPKQTQLYKQLKGIKESTGYISKLLDVN